VCCKKEQLCVTDGDVAACVENDEKCPYPRQLCAGIKIPNHKVSVCCPLDQHCSINAETGGAACDTGSEGLCDGRDEFICSGIKSSCCKYGEYCHLDSDGNGACLARPQCTPETNMICWPKPNKDPSLGRAEPVCCSIRHGVCENVPNTGEPYCRLIRGNVRTNEGIPF
jgi:hypothetical protein